MNTRDMKTVSPTLNLEITQENYTRAVQANSSSCIIADAIKEQYPQFTAVDVNVSTTRISDRKRGERYIYLTPPSAGEHLLAFDQGWPEESFPIKVRFRNAVKILPIARSASDIKLKSEKREKRMADLESKEKSGTELTDGEKRALGKLRNPKAPVERPIKYGATEVVADTPEGVVVKGGRERKRQDRLHANLLHGSNRHFGAKISHPSEVFQKAVDTAVKADRAKRKAKKSE